MYYCCLALELMLLKASKIYAKGLLMLVKDLMLLVQPVAPTTAEQRLAKKNELKARGTLLMALPDKHQLKFNIYKDAKSLMEAIVKRFGGNKEIKKVQKTLLKQQYENFTDSSSKSLDQIHGRLQKLISQLEILGESLSQEDINMKFLRSLPTDQSNGLQLDNDDLKQIDADDLEEMDLKWQMAMLTMRARRFLQRTGRNLGANGTTSIGFDMLNVKCYNCHKRGHFAREYRSPRDTRNKDTQRRNVLVETSTSHALVSLCDGVGSYDWSFQVDEEPTNYALMAFTSSRSLCSDNKFCKKNENVFEEDIKLLKLDVMLRDNALVEDRKKFEKAKQNRDEFKLKLENFQTFSKNLSQLPASQITDKTGLGYDNQVFNSIVFKCDELISSESYVIMPTSLVHDSTTKPNKNLCQLNRPSTPIIKDYVSDSKDKSEGEPIPTQKAPSFFQTSKHMKTPRPSVKPVEHPTSAKNLRKDIPKSRGHRHSWNRKACFVCKSLTHLIKDYDYYEKKMVQKPGNPQHALKDKEVIDSGCSRHMTWNISYLSDFEEINRGYVAFGRNPKGGKIIGKGKIRTGKLDFDDVYFIKEQKFNIFSISQMCDKKNSVLFIDTECIVLSSDFKLLDKNHVLLRVPRENNMYNVDLKNIVPSRDLTCLFAKAILDESNLWHRRLGHINFKTMNKLIKGNLVRGLPSKVFENNHTCVACKKGKQHRASCKSKPVSSISQPLQRVLVTKPHNKTPYELLLGRTPSIVFMRPFGCPITIFNTLGPLGKFDGNADEGFLVRYSVSSKAFRVFNSRTSIIQETLNINFLENQPNVAESGPTWLFDIDTLTQSMNYQPVVTGNQPISSAGIQENFTAGTGGKEAKFVQHYVLLPLWSSGSKGPQKTDA
nr:ribonuclease H-like domain-containing protein [Tanacetum cinerariifolium]